MNEQNEETIKCTGKNEVTTTETDRGIIYLSRIPPFMSVKKIRQIFSLYGEVDRIFLQPDGEIPEINILSLNSFYLLRS